MTGARESGLNVAGVRRVPKFLSEDERGRFEKFFSESRETEISGLTWVENFSSVSVTDTIRGLHLQSPPFDHYRLVSCLEGEIRDVCVDLRVGSPTESNIFSEVLTWRSDHSLLVPPGVAHGFAVLSGPARVLYFSTTSYRPSHDTGVLWSSIDLDWEIDQPLVSPRDQQLPSVEDFSSPFFWHD